MAKFTIKRNITSDEASINFGKDDSLQILDPQGNVIRNITLRGTDVKFLGDGLRSNNLGRKGEKDGLIAFLEHFLNTGDYPSKEEAKKLYNISEGEYGNYVTDTESIMEYNDINMDDYTNNLNQTGIGFSEDGETASTQSDRPYTSIDDYLDFDTEGTIGNRLYETFRDINQRQYESSMLESQYQERDMNRMIAGERQQLMDQIREDRRRALKSGLSQSAIANREIQGLLQGQAMASGYGEDFLRERRQLSQMGQNIDSMARGNVLDAYGQGMGNMFAALQTSDASDMFSLFKRRQGLNNRQTTELDDFIKKNS